MRFDLVGWWKIMPKINIILISRSVVCRNKYYRADYLVLMHIERKIASYKTNADISILIWLQLSDLRLLFTPVWKRGIIKSDEIMSVSFCETIKVGQRWKHDFRYFKWISSDIWYKTMTVVFLATKLCIFGILGHRKVNF